MFVLPDSLYIKSYPAVLTIIERGVYMIMLTSINNKSFYLNSDLIYRIDVAHDTIITLVDGKTLRVMDKTDEIIDKIIAYKRNIFIKLPEVVK